MLNAFLQRIPQVPSRRHSLLVLLLCLAVLIWLTAFSFPTIRSVSLTYPGRDLPARSSVTLPFMAGSEENVERFQAKAIVDWQAYHATTFDLYPDDCIETVLINGISAFSQIIGEPMQDCFPKHLTLDAEGLLTPGENEMIISIINLKKNYAFHIVTPFARWQAVAVAVSGWLAIYMACVLIAQINPGARKVIPVEVQRAFSRGFLALLGLLLTYVLLLDQKWWGTLETRPLVLWAACIVPLCLLTRALDSQRIRPLFPRPSIGWTTIAVVLFFIVAETNPTDSHYFPISYWLKCITASLAALFAVTPVFAFLHRARKEPRAVIAAGLAIMAPLIPFAWKLLLWEQMAKPTAEVVSLLLQLAGISTHTHFGIKTADDGKIQDYHSYVISSDFTVQIGSWCGGFEGIAMFLFLLAIFLLLDWQRFARIQQLWLLLPATVLFALALNVIRIAALFLYAEILIDKVGHSEATARTIDAFHSNAGLVLYTIAFGPFMTCVYRWERHMSRKCGRMSGR